MLLEPQRGMLEVARSQGSGVGGFREGQDLGLRLDLVIALWAEAEQRESMSYSARGVRKINVS